jgi:hypothetical protein
MHFALDPARVHSLIREMKTVTAPQAALRRDKRRTREILAPLQRHQGFVIHALRQTETRPTRHRQSGLWVGEDKGTPLRQTVDGLGMGYFIRKPFFTQPGNRPFAILLRPAALLDFCIQPVIEIGKRFGKFATVTTRATQHKVLFEIHDDIMAAGSGLQFSHLRLQTKKPGDKWFKMRRKT